MSFIEQTEYDYYHELLEELCELDHGLNGWELDFIESLSDWDGLYTDTQANKLQEIYDRHC